jgi:hypothetical protein
MEGSSHGHYVVLYHHLDKGIEKYKMSSQDTWRSSLHFKQAPS